MPLMAIHSQQRRHGAVPERAEPPRRLDRALRRLRPTAEERDCSREGVACRHGVFRDGAGRTVVETVFYDGPPVREVACLDRRQRRPVRRSDRAERDRPALGVLPGQPAQRRAGGADRLRPGRPSIGRARPSRARSAATWTSARVFVRLDGPAPQPEQPGDRYDDLVGARSRTCPTTSATGRWCGSSCRTAPAASAVGPVVHDRRSRRSASAAPSTSTSSPPASACSSRPAQAGFGVCDADFNSLFFQFGMNPFPLHAADAAGPWFLDPANIPNR